MESDLTASTEQRSRTSLLEWIALVGLGVLSLALWGLLVFGWSFLILEDIVIGTRLLLVAGIIITLAIVGVFWGAMVGAIEALLILLFTYALTTVLLATLIPALPTWILLVVALPVSFILLLSEHIYYSLVDKIRSKHQPSKK